MTDSIALSKHEQNSFFKDVNSIKKLIQKGQLKVKDVKEKRVYKRGVVYMGHLPPGFNEVAMKSYFKQFGTVTRVRLARSLKSGKSKGYGYVEYKNADVAKIVAETMNNYLMKNRLLKATYIPPENQHKGFFAGKNITENNTPLIRIRRKEFNRKNRNLAEKEQADAVEKNEARLKKIQKKIATAGVNYEIVHKDNSILPNSSSEIPSASSSKNKTQKKKTSAEKETDVNQVKKNMVSNRFVRPPSSDEDESDDDVITWDGKDDSDITDGDDLDETVEEETKHNFVRLPLKNKKVKKNKYISYTSSSSISPPKSKNNKKAKAALSPATSPKQKKNKNAIKSKSEEDNNKLIQKKKSGGIEKLKPKNKKESIRNDKKLKLAAAEYMKSQEVPKLKDQKFKIKSKKIKKQ